MRKRVRDARIEEWCGRLVQGGASADAKTVSKCSGRGGSENHERGHASACRRGERSKRGRESECELARAAGQCGSRKPPERPVGFVG